MLWDIIHKVTLLLACTGNKPLQDSIQIGFLFRAYTIAAHFTMGNALQIQRIDQLVDRHLLLEIRFVAQDEQRDTLKNGLLEEQVKFIFRNWQSFGVGRVDDEYYGVHTSAVALPHGPKAWLSSEIPTFQRHMAFLYALHIESNRRDGATYWEKWSAGVSYRSDKGWGSIDNPLGLKEGHRLEKKDLLESKFSALRITKRISMGVMVLRAFREDLPLVPATAMSCQHSADRSS